MAGAGVAPPLVAQAQVDAFRLRRHLLLDRPALSAAEAAGAVSGLHAQVQSCAELMWWARSSAAVRGGVERALWDERSVVKTWFMRGTLHVMPAADAKLWGAARASEMPSQAWFKYFELTPADLEAIVEAVPEAMAGGGTFTRRELAEAVRGRYGDRLAQHMLHSWGGLLKPLSRRGLVCSGPPRGNETTFVRLDEWVGDAALDWSVDAASAEAARRYLAIYGPATQRDFERWLGVTAKTARRGWSALTEQVSEVVVDGGRRAWLLTRDLDSLLGAEPDDSVRLLGGFDTWVLGHFTRDHLWPTAWTPRISRTAGWISPVVLRGGRVIGVWSHARAKGGTVAVSVELLEPLPARGPWRGQLETEAERLAAFLGGRLSLTV